MVGEVHDFLLRQGFSQEKAFHGDARTIGIQRSTSKSCSFLGSFP